MTGPRVELPADHAVAARAIALAVVLLLTPACSLETTPLIGRAPVGNAADGDADTDGDGDGDADGDADVDGDADGDAGPRPCREGASRACGVDTGECRPGAETCTGGVWGPCAGAVGPAQEQCDGRDQDCDGAADPDDPEADDQCPGLGARCLQREGRPTCAYYAPCVLSNCCDDYPGICGAEYTCVYVPWDCNLCESCTCSLCYR